jgi:hypothetical protein
VHLLYMDFETYYDADYSLRKMTTVEYVQDPRFETLGCAVAFDDGPSHWIDGASMQAWCDSIDWSQIIMVSHNMMFDGAVLAFRYGKRPALYVDTLSMARATLSHCLKSLSLEKVAEYFNLGVKLKETLVAMKGVRYAALMANRVLYEKAKIYACQDNDLCRGAFKEMRKTFPRDEMNVIDMLIRMYTEPKLQIDVGLLNVHLQEVQRQKNALLDRVGMSDNSILMSNDKFAEALKALGVDPPTKISATTGKEAWAFAKSDEKFKELADHDDPDVQALVAARLGHKTTIEETRTEKLIRIGLLYPRWAERAPWMPMPLRYSGAHTHRLSGSDGLNVQNFPRGGNLRKAIKPPKGHQIVTADLSQIEARIVCWLAGAMKMLGVFQRGEDPYAYQAYEINAMPQGLAKDDVRFKTGRQLGKGLVLGCGFGMSPPTFQVTVSRPPYNLVISFEEAQRAVYGYRNSNPEIPQLWTILGTSLSQLARRGNVGYTSGRVQTVKGMHYETDGRTVFMDLPSGLRLKYHDLRYEGNDLNYDYNGRRQYVYGAKATENLVQALARCVIMEAALRTRAATGYCPSLQVHDENVYVIPDAEVDDFKIELKKHMTARPAWAPDLPVATEVGSGDNYAEAK